MRLRIVVLALVVVGAVASDDDGGFEWNELESKTIVVGPNACATTEIRVDDQSGYRVSLQPIGFPSECSLENDIQATTDVYHRGECLELDLNSGKCVEPSKSGIKNADQMCENWSKLSTASYSMDTSASTVSSISGSFCFNNEQYFMSVRSSCAKTVTFNVKVDSRELTDGEEAFCDLVKNSFKETTNALGRVFLAVVIVCIVFIAGGITACCCLCSGCPCYYKWNRTPVIVQSIPLSSDYATSGKGGPALVAMGSVKSGAY